MEKRPKNLLPQGFYDSLDNSAYAEIVLNFSIVEKLHENGFKLVRPAMAEFEEFLDRDFLSEQFKVTDPISGKMMVIRNDITPQITRIVKDRYYDDFGGSESLKLSYTGQILKKTGKGKYQERQLTQTGFEIIGGNVNELDRDALKQVVDILESIKIDNYTIDLSIPNLSEVIFNSLDIKKSEFSEIQKNIEEKNISALKQKEELSLIAEIINIYEKAIDIETSIEALNAIKGKLPSKTADKYINEMIYVLEGLERVDININLLEISNFPYHSGVCYSIISKDSYEEIGRGGRYKISDNNGNNIDAVGFTFMLNPILRTRDNVA